MTKRSKYIMFIILFLIILTLISGYLIWWTCFAYDFPDTLTSYEKKITLTKNDPKKYHIRLTSIDYEKRSASFETDENEHTEKVTLKEGESAKGFGLEKVYQDKVDIWMRYPYIKRGRPLRELFSRKRTGYL